MTDSECRRAGDQSLLNEKLNHIRGAVFDLDGTILDSARMWADVDRRFFARRGMIMPEDYTQAIHSMEFAQTAAYTVERFGLCESPEELMREWTELAREAYALDIQLKPGAGEFLRMLNGKGIRLAVATSSREELFRAALRRTGVEELFCAFVTTEEVQMGKHEPAVYCRAAALMGLSPALCAVFEDILTGIQSAKRAGFFTVGVFDEGSAEQWNEITRVADACLESYM